MTYLSDIEIARRTPLKDIREIAATAGVDPESIELYGKYKAKLPLTTDGGKKGKLILVTALTPTSAGEGKTTTSIGLTDGLRKIGKNAMAALREPSLGPVFGLKGGATGGGQAQVAPMEDINLHFTGDFHAITSACNLLAAMLDNHIHQGNALGIDPRRITSKRCMDMNDRQLRYVVDGLGGRSNGSPREDGFDITVASEIMAVLCLADDLADLKKRLERIVVGYSFEGTPVTAKDLKAAGAMCALLKDAVKPNLVQTLEGAPALVHGGPFANIAHGCNSVIATRMALTLADYVVTEAGFGADLGAEKFIDIKCRAAGIYPDCVVLVATIRALKHHGGVEKDCLNQENVPAMLDGCANLKRHLDNIRTVWGAPAVVAINRFTSDTQAEIDALKDWLAQQNAPCALCEGWGKGGAGAQELAELVVREADGVHSRVPFFTYPDDMDLAHKIDAVARRVYGARGATFTAQAMKQLKTMEDEGFGRCPVCIAKTQYSFSDDAKRRNAPTDFDINIRSARLSAGAGFVVAFAGDIIAMPGLPRHPAALDIDVDENGRIEGLF